MSIEKVSAYFEPLGLTKRIQEFPVSSATVELAAQALGVEGCRIAKTLSFSVGEQCVLVVAAGDAKIDNGKYKAKFGTKAKMLPHDAVPEYTGHAVGGVCPFAVKDGVRVYLDRSQNALRLYSRQLEAAIQLLSSHWRSWSSIPGRKNGWMSVKLGKRNKEKAVSLGAAFVYCLVSWVILT